MVDKEIKIDQYYRVNGHIVIVTAVDDLDVNYTVIKWNKRMVCDRAVFSSVAKEIKLHG
ncbi:hypothetical protein BI043_gp070 [Escherichia phage UFV-AREG1]|uniref:Uncharacterized protein n=1 Tax=Escherichia phage UFV-AREG1 TaxID=1837867 RepID=A0A173GAE3_9CAUD|nr:hypothetical protein BI043_gp070 [Escherichia phage UFV-AREG1]ANH50213.1 hypothetical protein AREG1_00070 [Escherichia phage UFV-AREG1]